MLTAYNWAVDENRISILFQCPVTHKTHHLFPTWGFGASWQAKGGSIVPPRRGEGSLSPEQDRDGLIREVLQKIAAQVCMNVM
jgi:hypothetical protein